MDMMNVMIKELKERMNVKVLGKLTYIHRCEEKECSKGTAVHHGLSIEGLRAGLKIQTRIKRDSPLKMTSDVAQHGKANKNE
jgi:hypothetical protein